MHSLRGKLKVDESQRENRSREHARFASLLHYLTTPAEKRGDARALITKNILSGVLDTASFKLTINSSLNTVFPRISAGALI